MAENKVILEFVGDVSGLKPAIDTLSQLGNLSQEQVDAFKKANEQFKQANKSASDTEKSVSKLSNSFKQVSGAVAGKAIAEPIKELQKQTDTATNKTERLTTKLRVLKDALAQLEPGTAEFEKLAIEAAQLEDSVGDVAERVRVLASDTFKFDAAVGAIRGLTAAFSVAQGAAALFGEENEDVQKALLKVQAATALLTGVQELANIATGQGAFKLAVLNGAQKVNATLTSISTRAVTLFGTASTAAWAAATLGISLLIAGLVTLISNWDKVTKVLNDFIGVQEKTNDTISANIKLNDKQNAQNNVRKNQLQLEIELLKLRGESQDKIIKKEIELANIQIQSNLDRINQNNKLIEQFEKEEKATNSIIKNKKDLILVNQNLDNENLKLNASVQGLNKQLTDLADKSKKAQINMKELANDISQSLEEKLGQLNLLDEISKSLDNENAKKALELKIKKTLQDVYNNIPDEVIPDEKDLPLTFKVKLKTDEDFKDDFEKEMKQLAFDATQEISNAFFSILAQNRQAQFEEEQMLLDERRERELSNKNLTESQKAAIEKKFEQQRAAIRQRQFQAEKQAAIAQAVINGALAVTNILATTPKADFGAATIALLALNTIQTAAQIAVISSQKAPKFAKGGFIGGKPHSQGGTLIEAEKDEFVVRKSVARQNKSFLEAFNNGVPIAKALERASFMPSIKDNDMIVLENKANIDYSKLGRAVAREMSKLPQSELEVNYRGLFQSINSQQSLIEWQKRKYN